MGTWVVYPHEEPSKQATALAEQVQRDGGQVLAIYQDPVGERWQLFCLLPLDKVDATPYQRDLSPAHVKRLAEAVKKTGRFVDPIVAMSPSPGLYWTPNGNHRRAVLGKLKASYVPAILVPERDVAFQILALNTEKTHNLKEKSLEVIRMYRGLLREQPKASEEDYASGSSTRRTRASPAARSRRSCGGSTTSSRARSRKRSRSARSVPAWSARSMRCCPTSSPSSSAGASSTLT